jgi:hypothetical protein
MKKIALFIALAVLLAVMAFGQTQTQEQAQVQPQPQAQSPQTINYTNDSVARLSFLEGKAFLQRASDLGYEDVALNMPITEGDRLSVADGRVEVYLGHTNYLRLDQNTKVDFLNLPKKGYDRIRLRVWAGNVYLNVNGLDKEKDIEVHTGDVSVYVLEKGLYRLDINENEGTEIMVFDGLVEAAGEDGSNMINAGQRAELAGGQFTTRPTRFVAAADDAFGHWNESRDSLLRRTIADRHLPGDLGDYENELNQYGNWNYLPPYGNVWMPRGLGMGWHPYFYGRWVWLPLCGWTWMSYDPWGWAPYHYGRWGWDIRLGWYWIPTSIWGPAWVDWWWADDYFGWAPLGWYGYPLVFVNDRCYDHWDQDYPHDSKVLTVIHKNQLSSHDVSKVALGSDALKHVGTIKLTGDRMLAPRPISAAGLTQEKLGGNQVLLKSPGREVGTREIRRPTYGATATSGSAATTGSTTSRKVIERTTRSSSGTATQSSGSSSSTPRKIRKKDDSSYSPSTESAPAGSSIRRGSRDVFGYPSRTNNSQGSYGIRSLRYSSPMDRFYNGTSQGSISQYYSRLLRLLRLFRLHFFAVLFILAREFIKLILPRQLVLGFALVVLVSLFGVERRRSSSLISF